VITEERLKHCPADTYEGVEEEEKGEVALLLIGVRVLDELLEVLARLRVDPAGALRGLEGSRTCAGHVQIDR